jgi:hypothetical protein
LPIHYSVEYFQDSIKTEGFQAGPLVLALLPPPTLFGQTMQTLVFKNILLLFLATGSKKKLQHSLRVRRQLSGEKAGAGRLGV